MNDNAPSPLMNSYGYQSYQRQRQLTLGDLLLENRIVFLQGEIYTGNANEVVMKLLYLQSENRRKDIHFYLNSPGGDVVAGIAFGFELQLEQGQWQVNELKPGTGPQKVEDGATITLQFGPKF